MLYCNSKNSSVRGFSLTELMLAIFLLVTALLSIAGIFFAGTSAIKKGSLVAQATDIAYNEKIFLESYGFDDISQGLSQNISSVPANPFFSRYPKRKGNFEIYCPEVFYRNSGNLKIIYVKVHVSNIPVDKADIAIKRNLAEVNLDVIITPNKN